MNLELKGKIEEWHKAVVFWDQHLDKLDDEVRNIAYSESYCFVRRAVGDPKRELARVQEECDKLKKRKFSALEMTDYLRKFITISSRFLASPEFSDDFCAGYRELYGTLPADPLEEARRRREAEERRRQEEAERLRRAEEEERRRREEEERARRRREEEERRRREEEARRRRRPETVVPPPDPTPFVIRRRKRRPLKWVLIAVAALMGVSLVGNIFSALLSDFTSGEAEKADESRLAYVVADRLLLRSSPLATVESNVLSALDYGDELTVLADSAGWARVSAGGRTGYVSSSYLLAPTDFMRLENVWGNADARASVPQSRARLAVLDYLKREDLPSGKDGWQLFARSGGGQGVLFPRLDNGLDDFDDFAFLLVNNRTDERRLALYGFKPSEEPVLLFAEQAPARGGLSRVALASADGRYRVTYGGGGASPSSQAPPPVVKETAPAPTVQTGAASSSAQPRQPEPASPSRKSAAGVPVLSVWRSQFADMGADGRLRGQFGDDLTADMHFLAARIYCTANRNAGQPVRLDVKLFAPDGRLITGPDSPAGYTFSQTVQVPASAKGQFFYTLQGWGRAGGGFFRPGRYRYEVWIDGERAHWIGVHVSAAP